MISRPQILTLPEISDDRGALCFCCNSEQIPFEIQRVFWIYNIPNKTIRGNHAHKTCSELLISLNGKLSVRIEDFEGEKTFLLDSPCKGLFIPPMAWCELYNFSENCLCLCLASEYYNKDAYIDSYCEFKDLLKKT